MTNIMAKFMWLVARVDSRQYRQNSTELTPETFIVGVEVPLDKEHIFNSEEILKAQLGSGNVDVPYPIYTPKALQFCLDKLGEYLRDPDDVQPKDLQSGDDWDDTSTEPTEVAGIDWSDDNKSLPIASDTEGNWDEADTNVKEMWNESEEKWDE